MSFHGRMINIRDNADDEALSEYKRGHRDARHAAAEIANEADARIAELELKLAHAQNVAAAWEDAYTLYEGLWKASGLAPAKPILPREPHSWK